MLGLLIAASAWLAASLRRVVGTGLALGLMCSMWLLSDLYFGYFQVSQMASTIALLGLCAATAQRVAARSAPVDPGLVLAWAIPSGAALNFFDFLITPGASGAFYACVVTAAWLGRTGDRTAVRAIFLRAFLGFMAGFALAWATKWGVVAVLNAVVGQAFPPVSAADFQRYLITARPELFGQAILLQFQAAALLPLFFLGLSALLALVALGLWRQPRLPGKDALLLVPAFGCFFAMSEFMAPHTIVHVPFTQRAVGLSLVGIAVLLIALARRPPGPTVAGAPP